MNDNARSDSLRVLAAIRQSRHRKGQTPDTSPELQREHIQHWADSNGHVVIGESLDLDVSGSKVAAWNRPDLGAWLRERSADFDAICVDNLDRAGRNVEAFLGFQSKYLRPLGKTLHIVNLPVDLSTPEGQHAAISIMAVAQLQAEQHAAKMRDVNASVRGKGHFAGGRVAYGYAAVKGDRAYTYVIDEPAAKVLREMARRYLAGHSIRSITKWAIDSEIPSPHSGTRWTPEVVKRVLRSPAIAGIATRNREPLYSASGEYVTFCTPGIVSASEWEAIRSKMKANGTTGPRSNQTDLLHVAVCGHCGEWLHSSPHMNKGRRYRYLKCTRKTKVEKPGTCDLSVIMAELVESAIDKAIMAELGDVPKMDKKTTPADTKARELEFVETQLAGLAEAIVTGQMTPALAGQAERGLNARREQLLKEAHPEIVTWKPSGLTFGQYWTALTWPERHQFLTEHRITALVFCPPKGLTGTGALNRLTRFDVDGVRQSTITLEAGRRHVVEVWLGELEPLRKSAAEKG